MIVTGNNAEIHRNDLLHENGFKIKATGKAFKILSDGLYADKIRAVVRELSCNAYDAHVAAGNPDVPFEVHLPSMIEPHFTVRDHGIGLSKEDTQELFTTYFESTKTTSNDFIGALGLGSKSPFSYVDAFTVVSRFNGTKYTFSAFIGEDDMPKLALMGEQATTEANGLEVSMPVRRNDFQAFQEKASKVLSRFTPRPIITGDAHFKFNDTKVLMSGDGWRLMNKQDRWGGYSDSGAVAVQGKIEYPLNADALSELSQTKLSLLRYPFEIDFAIGSLEIAASREALGYKQATINAISQRLDDMIEDLPKQFQAQFDAATTLWEARIIFGEINNNQSIMNYVLRELSRSGSLKFKVLGTTISTSNVELKYADFPSIVVSKFHRHGNAAHINFETSATYAKNMNMTHSWRETHEKFNLQSYDSPIFFRNDLKISPITRLSKWTKSGANRKAVPTYLVTGDDADVEAFFKAVGEPPVHFTSELPIPPRAAQSAKVKVREFGVDKSGHSPSWTADNAIDLEDGDPGLYLYYAREVAHSFTDNTHSTYEFHNLRNLLIEFKIIDKKTRIIGVNKLTYDKLAANTDTEWQDFGKVVTEKFENLVKNDQTMLDLVAEMKMIDQFKNDYYVRNMIEQISKRLDKVDVDSPVVEFIGNYKRALSTTKTAKVQSFMALCESFGHIVEVSAKGYDFKTEFDKFKVRYPMFSLLDWYRLGNNPDMAIEYINMVEALDRYSK